MAKKVKDPTIWQELKRILIEQLKEIEEMAPEVLMDNNPEALHDLRVACRRSRSALLQVKSAFNPDQHNQLLEIYKLVSQHTNRLRDLDVYLEKLQSYFELLPENMHSQLRSYIGRVKQRRTREAGKIHSLLKSNAFKEKFICLKSLLLSEDQPGKGPGADKSARSYSSKKIRKKYSKVVKAGMELVECPDHNALHELRIQCKKLRYLMEFFRGSFNKTRVNALIRKLKSLQNILGDYNDLTVQIAVLNEDIKRTRPAKTDIRAMLGGLQTALFLQRKSLQDEFNSVFINFGSKSTSQRFQKIFSP